MPPPYQLCCSLVQKVFNSNFCSLFWNFVKIAFESIKAVIEVALILSVSLIAMSRASKIAHSSASSGYFFSLKYRCFLHHIFSLLFFQTTTTPAFPKLNLDLLAHNTSPAWLLFAFWIVLLAGLITTWPGIWFKRHNLSTDSTAYVESTYLIRKICWVSHCPYVLALPSLAYKSISSSWFPGWVSLSPFLKLMCKMFLTE